MTVTRSAVTLAGGEVRTALLHPSAGATPNVILGVGDENDFPFPPVRYC
jgi:hypothetical protein